MFSFTSSEISAERRRLYRRVSTASRRWCCCCCPLRNGEPLLDPPSPVESQSRENDSSPSWKLKRLRSSIDNGVHALGVGLGGAMPRITKFARTGSVRFKDVCSSPSDVCMWLGAAVSLLVLVLLNFNRAYAMHETIFKTDINSRTEALIRCACVPVACTAVNYFVQHLRRTVFFWEKRTEDRFFQQSVTRWIDPISIGLMLLAALFLIRNACCIILEDNVAQQVHFCFTGLMVMICAIFYFNMLDRINDVLHSMITDQEIINHSKPVEKMQNIVHNISRSGDTERDIVYSFSHTHTVPAKVLHYIWSIYYLIGKILGALVVLAFFAQVESETINRFLLGSLLISGAASGGFMLELGPSTISLLRLSLYKPFYVGDLVTLNKTGDMAMTEAVVGFVENITMMYVVIRNFEMKQVWISHKAFNELVIQNWTRRPTKTVLLNIGISTKAPKAKVQSLQEFGKKWIKGSPDIQQNNYQKCHITSTSNGYNLEIIFFPMVGVSHRQIRQKFLMSFMSAAERLNVPFVPLQLMQNFCEDCELGNVEAMSVAAHAAKEVALDDLLPDPDDLLERGKE